eukprot:6532-Heterococcus_DN1.PRE.1
MKHRMINQAKGASRFGADIGHRIVEQHAAPVQRGCKTEITGSHHRYCCSMTATGVSSELLLCRAAVRSSRASAACTKTAAIVQESGACKCQFTAPLVLSLHSLTQ